MPRVNNPGLLLPGQTTLKQAVANLTSAQIQALSVTPIQIVPAPGAGLVIVVFAIFTELIFNTQAYGTTGTDTVSYGYGNLLLPTVTATVVQQVTAAGPSFSWRPQSVQSVQSVLPGLDNTALFVKSNSAYSQGPIATATINAAGTGYVVNDTGSINGGSADATYQITSIGAAGAVTGFSITSGGTKYGTATAVATTDGGAQPGVGTGFKVNITAITPGDGTLKIVTYYQVIPVP